MALMGYEMFRNLASGRKIRKTKLVESFKKCLLDPGPDIIVCDEGHVLRREKSNLSVVVSEVATRRRIVLTGTPLQNNLKECNTNIRWCACTCTCTRIVRGKILAVQVTQGGGLDFFCLNL